MHYIEQIPGYNPIITIRDIPVEYHQDTLSSDDNNLHSWYALRENDKLFWNRIKDELDCSRNVS